MKEIADCMQQLNQKHIVHLYMYIIFACMFLISTKQNCTIKIQTYKYITISNIE